MKSNNRKKEKKFNYLLKVNSIGAYLPKDNTVYSHFLQDIPSPKMLSNIHDPNFKQVEKANDKELSRDKLMKEMVKNQMAILLNSQVLNKRQNETHSKEDKRKDGDNHSKKNLKHIHRNSKKKHRHTDDDDADDAIVEIYNINDNKSNNTKSQNSDNNEDDDDSEDDDTEDDSNISDAYDSDDDDDVSFYDGDDDKPNSKKYNRNKKNYNRDYDKEYDDIKEEEEEENNDKDNDDDYKDNDDDDYKDDDEKSNDGKNDDTDDDNYRDDDNSKDEDYKNEDEDYEKNIFFSKNKGRSMDKFKDKSDTNFENDIPIKISFHHHLHKEKKDHFNFKSKENPKIQNMPGENTYGVRSAFKSNSDFESTRISFNNYYHEISDDLDFFVPIHLCCESSCLESAIPGFSYCIRHIGLDKKFEKQSIFRRCQASVNGVQCCCPVFTDDKLCKGHKYLKLHHKSAH